MNNKPTVRCPGLVYPEQSIDVELPVEVYVQAISVKVGAEVGVGQPLLQIDEHLIVFDIQNAQFKLSAAQAYLNDIQTEKANAANIASALKEVIVSRSELTELQRIIPFSVNNNGIMTSAISGIVTQVNVRPGSVAAANTVLITVENYSTAVIHARLPFRYLGKIQRNQKAIVSPSALPGSGSIVGVVTSIIPVLDRGTDTFEVWISVPNTGKTIRLLPGMNVTVQIP